MESDKDKKWKSKLSKGISKQNVEIQIDYNGKNNSRKFNT